MSNKKTVDVVMSACNGSLHLKRQWDSIFEQENINVFVFIRDDYSSDDTVEVIEHYKYENPEKQVDYINGENEGYAKSFLDTLCMVGEANYYAFADQDDVWMKDKLFKSFFPEDVFSYMIGLEKRKIEKVQMRGFIDKRIAAEHCARKSNPNRELALSEIHMHFSDDAKVRAQFIKLECQAEIELSTVNLNINPIYDLCVEKGKQIYFVSDMYLLTEVIEKILRKNGHNVGRIYISSQNGFTKQSGKLYEYVRNSEGMHYNKWLHIGDSIGGLSGSRKVWDEYMP